MATRDESLATLTSLGVADVFVESYHTKKLPFKLHIYFGPPEEFFLDPDTQDVYTQGRLIPLLDDGNFGVVTFYDPDAKKLVQMDVEVPDESRTVLDSWQQYLADLFIGIAESGVPDDELEKIADTIGFQHVKQTLDFMNTAADVDWCAQRQSFVERI